MATRKPRKFGEGGGVREGQNANIDDDTRARAMKWVQQQQEGKSGSEETPKSAPKAAPKAAPKPAPKAEAAPAPAKKASAADIPNSAPKGWKGGEGEKVDSTELGRNINNALNATPGIQAVGRIAGAGKAAQKVGSRALAAAETPVTFLGKSGRRQVGGFDELPSAAKALTDGRSKAIASEGRAALAAPPKQITGPSKADLVNRDRSARAAARKEAMNEENAARHGLDRNAPDFAEKAGEVRQNLGGDEWSLGMKRGGKVKAKAAPEKAYKAGGSVKGWGIARGARKAKIV